MNKVGLNVILIIIGTMVGMSLAAAYIWIVASTKGLPTGDTFEVQGFILQICIIFFAGVFNTGAMGFHIFGREDKVEEFKEEKARLLILNIFGIALIALSWYFD